MIFRKVCLLFFLVLSYPIVAVKDTCLNITETQCEKIAKEKDYTETYVDSETKEKNTGASNVKMPSMDLGGLKYLFYFLVAGAILFVVAKILQNINSSPAINIDQGRVYTLEEVEDKMLEIDLDKILNDALIAKDYRLALRINFLIIIKKLTLSGKIVWTKEKTNWEYLNEIRDKVLAEKFKLIVLTFETIWYGEHDLNENQFNSLQSSYETFKNNVA